MARLEGRIADWSDHFPVWFQATWRIEKGATHRRIPKTLLQSGKMKETVGTLYKVSLRIAAEQLDTIIENENTQQSEEGIQAAFDKDHAPIKEPWEKQVYKRRRRSGPMSTPN